MAVACLETPLFPGFPSLVPFLYSSTLFEVYWYTVKTGTRPGSAQRTTTFFHEEGLPLTTSDESEYVSRGGSKTRRDFKATVPGLDGKGRRGGERVEMHEERGKNTLAKTRPSFRATRTQKHDREIRLGDGGHAGRRRRDSVGIPMK